MQLSALLAAAATVVSVSAAPEYGNPKCHGDMEYDPFEKICKCDKGEVFDAEIQRCRIKEVQAVEFKQCREGERLYCVRGEGDYVPYDAKSSYCLDDKHSKVICARRNKVSEVFKHEIRKEYEIAHVDIEEKEQERKVCERPRYFNYEKQICECPKNKIWDGFDCKFPLLKRPECPRQEKAFCAKNARLIVEFSEEQELCQDNGKNYVFCCGGNKDDEYARPDFKRCHGLQNYFDY